MADNSMNTGAVSAQDRAQRSVFVGNIPYEAGEDQLKEIFNQAGPVVSFRIVYDRETGKPKGYGFCEYQDVETAQSAMRNLNNVDFHGRPLRVGVAAGEQSKDDRSLQQALGGPLVESPYGDAVESEKAPEAISKAVASLPPEQMFELMKQMKTCIQNNPNEARNMLLQNPQLAYALLQAQIVMKIVDPHVALAMLHRQSEQIPPLVPTAGPGGENIQKPDVEGLGGLPPAAALSGPPPPSSSSMAPPPISMGGGGGRGRDMPPPRPDFGGPGGPGPDLGPRPPRGGLLGDRPPPTSSYPGGGDQGYEPRPSGPGPQSGAQLFPVAQDRDMRTGAGHPSERGLGGPPDRGMGMHQDRGIGGPPDRGMDNRGMGMDRGLDRGLGGPPDRGMDRGLGGPLSDRGIGGPPERGIGGPPGSMSLPSRSAPMPGIPAGRDPRAERDPRSQRGPPMGGPPPPPPPQQQQQRQMPGLGGGLAGMGAPGGGGAGQDQEKAALIMQVLQLSDEQIAMLPPDQRQSILILKDQIARSSNP